jgi:hypothetical protein
LGRSLPLSYSRPHDPEGRFTQIRGKELKRSLAPKLIAPLYPTPPHPKVRPASSLAPHGGRQCRPALSIQTNVPARLGLGDDQEFDDVTATTRAAHADAPILVVFARQYEITVWHRMRQTVPFDHNQSPRGSEPCPNVAPPLPNVYHQSALRGLNSGRPSSGSRSPRAKRPRLELGNAPSAVNSSSPAAKLNSVRA